MRQVTVFLLVGLLLAFSAPACKGGPTEPSDADVVARYTGRWRGNINGLEVVLEMRAEKVPGLVSLDGTATALNPTTGEMHRLKIGGVKPGAGVPLFNLFTEEVIGPDGGASFSPSTPDSSLARCQVTVGRGRDVLQQQPTTPARPSSARASTRSR
jgi:hypothetical protein